MMSRLLALFEGKKSKLILYNYDAFLIDYCPDDGKDLLLDFTSIIEEGGKFPVRIKYGANYEEMESLQLVAA